MDNKTEQKNTENKGKVLVGIVTSNKMDKTAVVRVDQYKKHPKYQKYVSSKKSYKIHDEDNSLNIGDKVEIVETKPISKDKRFKLSNIIEKAVIIDLNEE
ncbi:30S ribosomal protein S17 [Candidatus Parcubacteria bacterium]|nr:30S ribosomal protein S17 [Candidatus Parcubacteria bacterium]